jgi:hypothetical protein
MVMVTCRAYACPHPSRKENQELLSATRPLNSLWLNHTSK